LDFLVLGQEQAGADGWIMEEVVVDDTITLVDDGTTLGMTEMVLDEIAMATEELELGARNTLVEDDTTAGAEEIPG
jgi:hypothetical protein